MIKAKKNNDIQQKEHEQSIHLTQALDVLNFDKSYLKYVKDKEKWFRELGCINC